MNQIANQFQHNLIYNVGVKNDGDDDDNQWVTWHYDNSELYSACTHAAGYIKSDFILNAGLKEDHKEFDWKCGRCADKLPLSSRLFYCRHCHRDWVCLSCGELVVSKK